MYEEKLSIIIPTKNRQEYALQCIRTVLGFQREDFEIVVQDNSDDNRLEEELTSIQDSRIVYNYVPRCLSFCSNFEHAVEASSGDYIIIIGDDDGISSYIFDVIDNAREKGIEAINYSKNISYYWPNAVEGNKNNGKLVIRDVIPYVHTVDCSQEASKMMRQGDFNYQNYQFPRVYHGIVKREVFDNVRDKTGHYFGGLTPDIYSSVSLSFYVKKMAYINFPLSFYGICASSGSADSITGRHRGELKEAPHFRGTNGYKWDDEIPYIYTVDTIWAESALKAIKENGKQNEVLPLNLFNYIAYLCKRNVQFKDRFIDFYKNKLIKDSQFLNIRFTGKELKISMSSFLSRGFIYIGRVIVGRHEYNDVPGIIEASEIVKDFFERTTKFEKVVNILEKQRYE